MRSASFALLPAALGSTLFVLAVAACSSFTAEPDTGSAESGADAPLATADAPNAESSTTKDAARDGRASLIPVVLATGQKDISGLTANEVSIFITERGPGLVLTLPLAGGPIAELSNSMTSPSPSSIVAFTDGVVWADFGHSMLSYLPLDGSASSPTVTGCDPPPIAISTVAPHELLVARKVNKTDVGQVERWDLPPVFAASYATNLQNPYDVAASTTDVYWTESISGTVWTEPVGGSPVSGAAPLALGESGCESIAADSGGAYWTLPLTGHVRAKKPGDAMVRDLATTEMTPFSLAADDSGVYWLTADGKLRRSRGSELPIETLAQGFDGAFIDRHIQAIVLTANYVVWVTNDGKILRLAK